MKLYTTVSRLINITSPNEGSKTYTTPSQPRAQSPPTNRRRILLFHLMLLTGFLQYTTPAFSVDGRRDRATAVNPNASWMQDRLHGYRCQTLTTFTLPSSHDAGMYQTTKLEIDGKDSASAWLDEFLGWDPFWRLEVVILKALGVYDDFVEILTDDLNNIGKGLARTQDLSIREQLDYGIRVFDLRPKSYGGYQFVLHHSQDDIDLSFHLNLGVWEGDVGFNNIDMSMNGPALATVLTDVRSFMAEGHRELVILKLSHYYNFSAQAYTNLLVMVQDYLGPWLLKSDLVPQDLNLANTPFGILIGNQGRVLVLCDSAGAWAFTDPATGIWPSTALTAGGAYTDTDNPNTMRAAQAQQFQANNTPRFKLSWTLTMQIGLSALNETVRSLAGEINPYLWPFVAGLTIPNTNGNVLNEIMVDFVEDTSVTDLAIALNNQCPDCVIVAAAVVGGGTGGVILDGSRSTDPDNDALSFEWKQLSGGSAVTIHNSTTAVATFDAPINGCGATFEFMLTVTDARGASDSKTVQIQVIDVTTPVLSCDAPTEIAPPATPVTYTASAQDICDANPLVEITDYRCYKFTGNGKLLDMTHSARVLIKGNKITLLKTGGVGTLHSWRMRATDESGNISNAACVLEIGNPGRSKRE